MGSNNPQLIIQGAYSEHFQRAHKNGIEILKQESFYEQGDVLSKIRKLQQETQKRRKDQQIKRELEEKKEEERRKHILEERRRHLQEVTEKYQRLGRKRFRLLTATTSPLSRAGTAFDDMTSPIGRADGTVSALPLNHISRFDINRVTSADTISRMHEQAYSAGSNGHTSDSSMLNEYKKPNSAMLSALNPPSVLQQQQQQQQQQQSHQSSNNSGGGNVINQNNSNTGNNSALSSYSAQFQAVQARHQRLLEQLGLKPNEGNGSRPNSETIQSNGVGKEANLSSNSTTATPISMNQSQSQNGNNVQLTSNLYSTTSLSATGSRIHIDAVNSANSKFINQASSANPASTAVQTASRPSSAAIQLNGGNSSGNNSHLSSDNNGSRNGITGLPTVVATATTVQEAMQASYSLSSRGNTLSATLKPIASTVPAQTLQQSVLFLQSNGVITSSNKPSGGISNGTNNHTPSNNSHQLGTIIHMQQQQTSQQTTPSAQSQPQIQLQLSAHPTLLVGPSSNYSKQVEQQSLTTTASVKPVGGVAPQETPQPKLTAVETAPVQSNKQSLAPIAPKERPIGLVRPSSASSMKREDSSTGSIALEDSLNVDMKPSIQTINTNNDKNQQSSAKPFIIEQHINQFGSIKTVTLSNDDRGEVAAKQQQIFLTNVPTMPDVVQVFNATAPDGGTLLAQLGELKNNNNNNTNNNNNNNNQANNQLSLNFKIPSGINNALASANNNNNKVADDADSAGQSRAVPRGPGFSPPTLEQLSTGSKPPSNIPVVGSRPPSGRTSNLIPVETAYTDLTGPVNNKYSAVNAFVETGGSMKRYNSDSALAEQQQPQQFVPTSRAADLSGASPAFNEGNNSVSPNAAGKQSTIKSILKRSPSLERTMTNLSSAHSHSSQETRGRGEMQQMQQAGYGGAKSVTFGHVHIADLTADGPISVRDSIELTKFKQVPEDNKPGRRKVMFTMDAEDYDPKAPVNSPTGQTGLMKSSSGSQIIRVEMGGRSTPRSTNPAASPLLGLPRGGQSGAGQSSLYANSAQRAASSVGNRQTTTQQQQTNQIQPFLNDNLPSGSSAQATNVEHVPSDAEINWLWEKVRSCLNRSQSATVSRPVQQMAMPNSFSAVPRIGSAPTSSTMSPSAAQNSASANALSRLNQSSHKVYIDGSNVSTAGAQMYIAGPGNTSGLPGGATFNAAQSHQIRAPQSSSGPLKTLVATGVNVNPTVSRPAHSAGNREQQDVSQSTMAFLAAEQLVAGGLSESVIHQTMDQIQQQQHSSHTPHHHQQQQQQQQQQPSVSTGNGRSALSMEEDQIMKSLDRINDRLQYLEVTGQSTAAVNKASPSVTQQQPYNTLISEVPAPQHPTLAYTHYVRRDVAFK